MWCALDFYLDNMSWSNCIIKDMIDNIVIFNRVMKVVGNGP